MNQIKQTKADWANEQIKKELPGVVGAASAFALFCGMFAFGIGCLSLSTLQAIGCGITSACLVAIGSVWAMSRRLGLKLKKEAKSLQFRDVE